MVVPPNERHNSIKGIVDAGGGRERGRARGRARGRDRGTHRMAARLLVWDV